MQQIIHKYVQALLMFSLPELLQDLHKFTASLPVDDIAVQRFYTIADREQQITVTRAILKKLALTKHVQALIIILVKNKRLANLPEIIAALECIELKNNNQVRVQLYSAIKPENLNLSELKVALSKRLQQEPLLEIIYQPDLLDGYVLYYQNNMLDCSLQSKLTHLHKSLTKHQDKWHI